ncbi:hypothetical protein EXIGLDRAFT_639080 [Exidia glandulosa HHB12029]|uniref:WAC domain-containing protein n=1 Tax=Exidia glandulosa HHB12029 TaxID=1314781 RepID=A0A165NFU7_EXIGL|nr:hypothetical protein EXIGLDRAFT_639080 [Exidia glandulosa HHB12029]
MPTCRRKRVLLTEPSPQLLADLEAEPNKEVFYLAQTGEIFPDYESYSSRLSFYKTKQFQCDVTGKGGLDFFQALDSEQQEARTLHARFPEQLKGPVLRAVQWQVMGRLDHLVEAVFDRFKDRYFDGERVFIDLNGEKFWGRIVKVVPPGATAPPTTSTKRPRASSSAQPAPSATPTKVHSIGGDLKTPIDVVNSKDDPAAYVYQIHMIDEAGNHTGSTGQSNGDHPKRQPGSMVDVHAVSMSRDRLAFSKSILRRFIRDCVDRDAAIASPWTVKRAIAERYGVEVDMPEETRKGVDEIKRGEIQKRRKVATPPKKEGPPAKKQKKISAEERAQMLKEEEEELALIEAEERARELAMANAPKKKKKPVKFPAEDMDVRLTEKEKKSGASLVRPIPNRDLPFDSCGPGVFESFLMSWNFLHVFSAPLNLSTFTLDEYEHALRHSTTDPPCALITESHQALMSVLRNQQAAKHHPAVVSLMNTEDGPEDVVSSEELLRRIEDVGNTWEMGLNAAGREPWESCLIGCLKDYASIDTFPRLRAILTYLLFDTSDRPPAKNGRAKVEPEQSEWSRPLAEPEDRYPTLPVSDKIAILAYLADLGIASKPIHHYMDNCETKLTELRKEKIEVNREKKNLAEKMSAVVEKAGVAGGDDPMQVDEDSAGSDAEDSASLLAAPLDGSEAGSSAGGAARAATGTMRQRLLRQKAQNHALAKQQELAKSKNKGAAAALAEYRRLTDEVAKQDRKLENIEREFRKLLGVVRLRPMGKDRFYNRIWWLDGLGGGNLVGSSGQALYGAGRVFIQGASEIDREMLGVRENEDGDVQERREAEETPEAMLKSNEWAVYDDADQLEEFFAWLNPKGNREVVLKNQLFKWWDHIIAGVRKRQSDATTAVKVLDARRSTRGRNSSAVNELMREPYMLWTNKLSKQSKS